ncbi:MAG: helix-turn-helix domain-containing protein [Candidatus Ratteibacteria bacterium]|nr:helix-turn-helix domain-containing protein [Candidatus Ratteibacteria bacterium]
MNQIHKCLKETREEKGITTEKVFYEAHISPKFIRMIEDGEWEKFPSKVQMKGFLRIYGEYLGIPSSVIEEGIKEIEQQTERKQEEDAKNKKNLHKKKTQTVVDRSIYILLLLLIFFVLLYFWILYLLPE